MAGTTTRAAHPYPDGGDPPDTDGAVRALAESVDSKHALEGHTHPSTVVGGTAPASSAVGDATAEGVSTAAARADHKHGREAFGSPASSAVGDAAAAGSSASVARADHKHAREAFGASVAQTSYGLAKSDGSASTVARSNHTHGTPALPSPSDIGAATSGHSHSRETASGTYIGDGTANRLIATGINGSIGIVTARDTLTGYASIITGSRSLLIGSSSGTVDEDTEADGTNIKVSGGANVDGAAYAWFYIL